LSAPLTQALLGGRRFGRLLTTLMLVTDIGFLIYWLITLLHVLPDAWLFKDYDNPILQSWNWSFLPLDLLISCTGLSALRMRDASRARGLTTISLVLTSCSGLMAISFWALRNDFSWVWWAPNLFLLAYPLPFLVALMTPRRGLLS
jgi:hypothetical protein